MRTVVGAALAAALALGACDRGAEAPEPKPAAKAPEAAVTPSRSGYITVNGLRMYYQVHGDGAPLLLLHGGLTTIETSFNAMLPQLTQGRQVIAVEQQAHGRTADIPDRPLTFEQEADDTAALLRQLGIGPVDVFGYSDGGNVALGLAIRHPELVKKVVVAGVNVTNEGLQPGILEFMAAAARQPPAEAAAGMPPDLKVAYEKVAPRPQDWPVLVSKVMRQAVALKGWTPAQLKAIRAPTLIVIGDRDIITPEHAVQMSRTIPNAQLAILPGRDHFQIVQGGPLPGMIDAFLKAPAPAPATAPAPAPAP